MKFSLIIPVYNKESFLRATLDSVVKGINISPSEFECILVDESSTDRSGEICTEYVAKYPFFKYIRIKNDGFNSPSNARNHGKMIAIGEYVMFLDADDLLCDGFMKTTIDFLDEHTEYDFYICNFFDGDIPKILSPRNVKIHFAIYGPPLSCCIFRKAVVDEVKFVNLPAEDVIFTEEVLINKHKYHYREDNPRSYHYNTVSREMVNDHNDMITSKHEIWYAHVVEYFQHDERYTYMLNEDDDVIIKPRHT